MGAGVRDAFPPPMCVVGLWVRSSLHVRTDLLSAKLSVGTGFAYMWGKTN